jgi:hypothetical protein
MTEDPVHRRFTAALDDLIEQVKADRSILAAVLGGSLSHDKVWAKSDIDLVFVTVDDRKTEVGDLALYADGVNVHTLLLSRAEFRTIAEGSTRNSFMHSFLAKGRLIYTHDPTIERLCEGLRAPGAHDARIQLLRAATAALPPVYKAHKWWLTRSDLDYTALWILYAATPLAQVEVIDAGQLVDREVIPQALRLNPAFFARIYSDLLHGGMSRDMVTGALAAVDEYLVTRARRLFAPVLEYFVEAGEVRSCRDIEHHFSRSFDVSGVTTACEYLADQGLLGKASIPARLTRRSNLEVQELAFYYVDRR